MAFQINPQGEKAVGDLAKFCANQGVKYDAASQQADIVISSANKIATDDGSFNQALADIVDAYIKAPD